MFQLASRTTKDKNSKKGDLYSGCSPTCLINEDLQVQIRFGIVQNVSLNVLLGTKCITKRIRGISFMDGKIVPEQSVPVTIL